eukprot:gene24036-29087_t
MAMKWRAPSFAMDPVQYRMFVSLRQTVETILKTPNGIYEIEKQHHLKGLFVTLIDPSSMRQALYPGTPQDMLSLLPRNLREVLQWKDLSLDYSAIAANATEVLKNIKAKGARTGDIMDPQTEQVLLPQIAQEALARAIVTGVHALKQRQSKALTTSEEVSIASSCDPRALQQVLDGEVVDCLCSQQFAIQKEYMGKEWAEVVRKDLSRYLRDEDFSMVNETGEVVVTDTTASSSGSAKTGKKAPNQRYSAKNMQISWLDPTSPYIQRSYPALHEALALMTSLPFELNHRGHAVDSRVNQEDEGLVMMSTANSVKHAQMLRLLEPLRGSCMLVYYPAGCSQKTRLDCRTDLPGGDSGIRLTAAYHLCATARTKETSDFMEYSADSRSILWLESDASGQKHEFPMEDDMLTLHRSDRVKNARSTWAGKDGWPGEEWFGLFFFMHAREQEVEV